MSELRYKTAKDNSCDKHFIAIYYYRMWINTIYCKKGSEQETFNDFKEIFETILTDFKKHNWFKHKIKEVKIYHIDDLSYLFIENDGVYIRSHDGISWNKIISEALINEIKNNGN